MQTVDYEIAPDSPRTHVFRIACTVATPDPDGQRFTLPAWIPGSYLVREFARHIMRVEAECGGQTVTVAKLDKQTWRCEPCEGPLTVRYEVYARDDSVRAAYLDHRRGFFNGTSVFLRPLGHEDAPCRVRLGRPAADTVWRVATTLPSEDVDAAGFGDYGATDYFSLIDHPVAMAEALDVIEFEAAGVPHALALVGRHDADRDRLVADLKRVCETHARMYGRLPVERYLFLAQIAPSGYGGLEHRDCSALVVARDALPQATAQPEARSTAYTEMLGLCSHEYFHLWNVKRIRPAAVAASDLAGEAYFRDLWAYEGVTSYYDDLGLVRAGVLPWQAYLDRVAGMATRVERTPGRHRQSLAESSFDAWIKLYRPDENTPNAVVSYYGKGALVALALDLTLRLETDGSVCLDDVMRAAWRHYGASEAPVPENGLEALASEVAGIDLTAFFDTYVRGTADAPLETLLPRFGVRCERVTAGGDDDFLRAQGLRLAAGTGGDARLQFVLAGGAAEAAGLSPGDTVIAVDGLRVTETDFGARLRRRADAESVHLHVFRGDELLELTLRPRAARADRWRLTLDPEADADAAARRAAWLEAPKAAPVEATA